MSEENLEHEDIEHVCTCGHAHGAEGDDHAPLKEKKKREKEDIDGLRHVRICAQCGITDVALNRCGGCNLIYYCSKECQVGDWKKHGVLCQPQKHWKMDRQNMNFHEIYEMIVDPELGAQTLVCILKREHSAKKTLTKLFVKSPLMVAQSNGKANAVKIEFMELGEVAKIMAPANYRYIDQKARDCPIELMYLQGRFFAYDKLDGYNVFEFTRMTKEEKKRRK